MSHFILIRAFRLVFVKIWGWGKIRKTQIEMNILRTW